MPRSSDSSLASAPILPIWKFGVRSKNLSQGLKKTGRRVPGYVHRECQVLVDAEKMAGNPKLLRQIDPQRVERALTITRDHLDTVDPVERRKTATLNLLGSVVFNLLVVFGLFVGVLVWRGLV